MELKPIELRNQSDDNGIWHYYYMLLTQRYLFADNNQLKRYLFGKHAAVLVTLWYSSQAEGFIGTYYSTFVLCFIKVE